MEYVIILATAVAVLLSSWLAFRLLRKRREFLTSCFYVSDFWLGIDLFLAGLLLWVLYSDFALSEHPNITFILQCVFIESFACAPTISCYAANRDLYERIKEENDSSEST